MIGGFDDVVAVAGPLAACMVVSYAVRLIMHVQERAWERAKEARVWTVGKSPVFVQPKDVDRETWHRAADEVMTDCPPPAGLWDGPAVVVRPNPIETIGVMK